MSHPGDGESVEQKAGKVEKASQKFLDLALQRFGDRNLAKMIIALRTADHDGAASPDAEEAR
jgi:hypothetical protein